MSGADLQLPSSDAALDPDLAAGVGRHLSAVRTARHPGRRSKGTRMEVVGTGGTDEKKKHSEDEDVDDDWFGAKDEDEAKRFVRLSVGKVPRRAGTMIKRRIRGGKRKGVPAVVVEEEDGGERFELEAEEDEGGAPFVGQTSTSTYSDGPVYHSPASSSDSLVTLDLPFFTGGSSASTSSRSQSHGARLATRSTLPTLSELRSHDSTSSSSPATSVRSPSPIETPTRTLSIDASSPASIRRTTSRLTYRSGNRRHLHLPGRPKFLPKKKRTGRVESSLADGPAFDEAVAAALKQVGVLQDDEEKVEVDVLYEHQRGLVVFGLPKFSANALLQIDPSEWCDESLRPSPFTPHDYPCPPYWCWRDSWSYALRFRSRFWRGEATFPYAFVRRRRWIRMRVYRPQPFFPASSGPSTATGSSKLDVATEISSGATDVDDQCGAADPDVVSDLRSACRALPLSPERRAALFAESATASAEGIDPRDPFVSYRRLKLEAQATGGASGGEEKPVWRDAVRELNYRRVAGVLKSHGRIDRRRLDLWRIWLGAPLEQKRKEGKGVDEAAEVDGGNKPEIEDVWDVIESRLDLLLTQFDYHLTRHTFLSLILSLHPLKATAHRHAGYDASASEKSKLLEGNLRDRLQFYAEVEAMVKEYERGIEVREPKEEKVMPPVQASPRKGRRQK
ncbi:hypothetical protein JCM10213v2_006949 [Rhodosporidiobolus nylandii]